jgi:hypothetical protein
VTALDLTVAARRTLLDALVALGQHRGAVVLVGAQAIYLRTDRREMTFAASYTSDADLALDPRRLSDFPLLEDALESAGFAMNSIDRPGIWATTTVVDGRDETLTVDLLVPEALAGPGTRAATLEVHGRRAATRAATLEVHGRRAATRARGLEAALVDHAPMVVGALDPDDHRRIEVEVAGLPALLVAKTHKLHERIRGRKEHRIRPKDAADIYRILLVLDVDEASATLRRLLTDDLAGPVTTAALEQLYELFGAPQRPGTALAVTALAGDVPAVRVQQVCTTVSRALRLAVADLQ